MMKGLSSLKFVLPCILNLLLPLPLTILSYLLSSCAWSLKPYSFAISILLKCLSISKFFLYSFNYVFLSFEWNFWTMLDRPQALQWRVQIKWLVCFRLRTICVGQILPPAMSCSVILFPKSSHGVMHPTVIICSHHFEPMSMLAHCARNGLAGPSEKEY